MFWFIDLFGAKRVTTMLYICRITSFILMLIGFGVVLTATDSDLAIRDILSRGTIGLLLAWQGILLETPIKEGLYITKHYKFFRKQAIEQDVRRCRLERLAKNMPLDAEWHTVETGTEQEG